ncbi:MAG: Gfo/Idh/MocA family oxidoreductase [Chloroflexota bacterium]|nr:Gfo/Idh/MocA family oxidoreductase [Chloroflexota bacterium]
MTLSIGLVGTGACAERIARAAAATPDVVLAAVAAPAGADAFAARHGVPLAFKDYRSLLETVHVEALVIAAPTDIHYDVCIAAADAGVSVVCPSPLAVGPAESDLLAALAARNALRLAMLCPEAEALASVFGGGLPRGLRWTRRRPRPRGWRLDADRAGGGVLMDLGAAALLALAAAGGRPPAVRGAAVEAIDEAGWEPLDVAVRLLVELGGAEAELALAWSGAEGIDTLDVPGVPSPVLLPLSEFCWQRALANALEGRAPSFEDGYRALEAVSAAYAAAGAGRVSVAAERPERAVDFWLGRPSSLEG